MDHDWIEWDEGNIDHALQRTDPSEGMTEAEMADYYDRTNDLSGFQGEPVVAKPFKGKRLDSSISVRFSEEQMTEVERAAEAAGMKVTAFIRAAALTQADAVSLRNLRRLVSQLTENVEELVGKR